MREELSPPDIYQQLVDASPVGLIIVHAGKIVFVNRAVATLLGWDHDSIVGLPFRKLLTHRNREMHVNDLPELRWGNVGFHTASEGEVILGARVTPINYAGKPARLVLLRALRGERVANGEITIQYKVLVDKLADIVFVIDLAGRFVFLNQGFTRATGYPCRDWIGRRFTEIIAPDYVQFTREQFRAGPPPGGGVSQYEIAVIARDGKRIPTEIRVTSLCGADGREIGRIGTARDVSGRRRMEEELRRTNAELDMILNTMGEGVVVLDAQHRMVRMNRKACELFGYSHEELVGKRYTSWCHPEFLPTLRERLAEREAGKSSTYEAWFLRKGGSPFYAQVTAVPIIDNHGTFKGSIGCLRDVTHERELLRQVEELNEFNRRLIEVAGVWIDVEDPDGRVLVWNKEAERISGYTRAEVVMDNTKVWEWLYPNPNYRTAVLKEQQREREADTLARYSERTIHTKSGDERIISWHGRPLRLSDGRTGWLAVGHDVTDQRMRERRLREYAALIERMNQERTHLLSMVAHELRTPLTVISGFVELMARDGGLSPVHRERLAKIGEQADRLSNLVTRLLNIAHVDAESNNLRPTRLVLSPLIIKVLHTVEPMLADDKDRISFTPAEMLAVYADPKAVEAILLNLVTNAIAYTPAPGKITVQVRDRDDTVQVDVSDEGVGLSPPDKERIFTEFYRTPSGRKLNQDGHGIGLSIVKRLVERSGGKVWVESPGEGKGSTFSFTLPKYTEGRSNARTDLRG